MIDWQSLLGQLQATGMFNNNNNNNQQQQFASGMPNNNNLNYSFLSPDQTPANNALGMNNEDEKRKRMMSGNTMPDMSNITGGLNSYRSNDNNNNNTGMSYAGVVT